MECLVSDSNCVIYIFPLLLSYKYVDHSVLYCDKQRFLRDAFCVGGQWGRAGPDVTLWGPWACELPKAFIPGGGAAEWGGRGGGSEAPTAREPYSR